MPAVGLIQLAGKPAGDRFGQCSEKFTHAGVLGVMRAAAKDLYGHHARLSGPGRSDARS